MALGKKSVLAIIPARAGSRRVPLKNLQLYQGKSLIRRAIECAQGCEYIDTIAVSSDSDEILRWALPPVIPIRRPPYLASDQASSEAVIVHAIYSLNFFGEHVIPPHDIIVLLQPTSPLRTPADICKCLELSVSQTFTQVLFQSSFTTTTVVSTDEQGKRNGAVYVTDTTRFLSRLDLDASRYYKMPNSRSLDIDYPEDFHTQYVTEGAWKLPKA